MRRLALFAIALTLAGAAPWGSADAIVSHALAIRGAPKYSAGFEHFDYVNPDAPQGGTVTYYTLGTFDSFNRYAQRGDFEGSSDIIYDSLMVGSADEIEVYYGLVAEKVEHDSDYRWIIFHLNPRARHQDGQAITAEDVVFSFNKFVDQGVPQFKTYYRLVDRAEALDSRRARFTLSEANKEILFSLGSLAVLPKHYWESRDLSEPLGEVPLGSGAYTVSDYDFGQYVVYERLKDYWARDLPVNRGRHNFDYVRYEYFRDDTVAFEAFKAGEYDLRVENEARKWATQYTGPAIDAGNILKAEIPHEIPPGMQCFIFNTQRPIFQDRRVRMALNYMMDFEWMNRNLFYDQYTRTRSYFENTEYAATGLPGPEELAILEPIRGKVPPEVFTEEYNPPVTDASGNIRSQMREALRLLKEAGWEIGGAQATARGQAGPRRTVGIVLIAAGLLALLVLLLAPLVGLGKRAFSAPKIAGAAASAAAAVAGLVLLLSGAPAGEIHDRRLASASTGEPFEFELMIYTSTTERIAIPFQKNLERIGITMSIRLVDSSQYLNRWHEHDFDMVSSGYSPHFYPDTNLKISWGSEYLDSTYNQAAVQDEAVDYLLEGIDRHQEDEELLYWGRALDRVLTWNHYVIPQWHISTFRVAYWDKFGRPEVRPSYALGLDTWWLDTEKERRLPSR